MNTVTLIALGLIATCFSDAKAQDAKQTLDASGVQGGLVVVIGCNRPALLADMQSCGPFLVHGLDRDPARVAAARRYLLEKGLYGLVTVSRLQGTQLPFVDSLVNLSH